MSKKSFMMVVGVFFTLASTNYESKADSVPWGYSAGNAEIFNNNNANNSSSVQFAGANGVATGSSGIIIYGMTTTSSTGQASPDSFSNVPFDLAFTLTDVLATGSKSGSAKTSDVVKFSGLFSASNVTTTSLLPGAAPWSSPIAAQVVLGADDVGWRTYSVLVSSFTSPGQPNGSPGSIQAVVRITSGDRPTDIPPPVGQEEEPAPSAAPEPASLLMASFGVLPIFVVWRKRRNAAKI